jgi:hypothetical protein
MSAAVASAPVSSGSGGPARGTRGERLKEGAKEHDVRTANIIAGEFTCRWRLLMLCAAVYAEWFLVPFGTVAFPANTARHPNVLLTIVSMNGVCSQGCCRRRSHVVGPTRYGQNDPVARRRRYCDKRWCNDLEVGWFSHFEVFYAVFARLLRRLDGGVVVNAVATLFKRTSGWCAPFQSLASVPSHRQDVS